MVKDVKMFEAKTFINTLPWRNKFSLLTYTRLAALDIWTRWTYSYPYQRWMILRCRYRGCCLWWQQHHVVQLHVYHVLRQSERRTVESSTLMSIMVLSHQTEPHSGWSPDPSEMSPVWCERTIIMHPAEALVGSDCSVRVWSVNIRTMNSY